jgi:2-polyprenyl-6-methoxyphenol hydroxylase-like FAD-dependent oxidoreductase
MNRTWDVIVVGARVAGAATAMLLARAGLRVLCVDRSRRGSDTLSTHALMRGGVLQLTKWGLLDAVVTAGTPPVRRIVFHYGAEQLAVTLKPAAGTDALYAARRTVLDAMLVDAAQQSGVSVEFGTPVVGLSRAADKRVTGVLLQDRRTGRLRAEHAAIVVGADGRESLVAREVSATNVFAGKHAGSYLYGYWHDLPTDGYEWSYRPGLAAGTIPTNDGATCVFLGGTPARIGAAVGAAGSPAAAIVALADQVGLGERMRSAHRIEAVRFVHSLPPGYLRTAQGPGWALVGDAGHWMDPMSTHGLTSALRDAELLVDAITSPAAKEPGTAGSYQHTRDRLSRRMLETSDEIASFTWDLDRIRDVLRQMSSAMTEEVEALALPGQAA